MREIEEGERKRNRDREGERNRDRICEESEWKFGLEIILFDRSISFNFFHGVLPLRICDENGEVEVEWSASLPSTSTIRVRIQMTSNLLEEF